MIRMGCCCLSNETVFRDFFLFPFDYGELPLKKMHTLSDSEIDEIEATFRKHGRRAEAFNNFFPAEIILLGPETDHAAIDACLDKNLSLLDRFGAEIAVIGSGKSRRIPEGYTKKDADEQFGEILFRCCDRLREIGVRAVLEPLSRKETNYVNTVLESAELSRKVNHPNLGTLVDFYHFSQNEESLSDLEVYRGSLAHVHLARPLDRKTPQKEDAATLRSWAEALHSLDYDGRISLEAGYENGRLLGNVENFVEMFPIFQG